MTSRDMWTAVEALSRFAGELESGGADVDDGFAPVPAEPHLAPALPGRTPGSALAEQVQAASQAVPGPRSIILDCGISRRPGFTHVLCISPAAESILGSDGFARLGEIVGRVYGVMSYEWEGIDRLHLVAGDLPWADLLAEAREALAVFMAGRV